MLSKHGKSAPVQPCTLGHPHRLAILRLSMRRYPDRVPAGEIAAALGLKPFAVQVLKDKGHDTSVLRAKNVAEFSGPDAPPLDFVFTVCDRAANEECPAWEGQPVTAHWGMPDPVKTEGTDAQKSLAFQQAYGALRNRILAFAALPIASLDRIALQQALDDIGAMRRA